MKKIITFCCLAGLTILLTACSTVAPWERDVTARKSMQLTKNANFAAINDHIYYSKEGSTGGRSTDGGGCGCN